ncbi:hypothetical protein SeMB42_g01861 [Synchytrium endobioticum]|uniref:Deacetylase sirtuin-type domain-containing protein n=1 Tax=Synchytrium endobioticum TaxID=286115 RepID=A0A507DJ95_9FUNG|nr:hypothetical protein SeMB42_g01861 [Synchytrium endobioticum]
MSSQNDHANEASANQSELEPELERLQQSDDSHHKPDDDMDVVRWLLASLSIDTKPSSASSLRAVLEGPTIESIAHYIKTSQPNKWIVMTGAGISTGAGIPDFRTPGTGLYSNLQKYNLPFPEAIFQISYFLGNPEPFYLLAKEMWPGTFKPTLGHYLIRLLAEKNVLLRNFTQNIDTLERVTGIQPDYLVEAHGSFGSAQCAGSQSSSKCGTKVPIEQVRDAVYKGSIPKCPNCYGLVKPDIVFFGESLPQRFFQLSRTDFRQCDLLIVIGTSLQVQPFASLIDRVPDHVPRLLINLEQVGDYGSKYEGFDFSHRLQAHCRDAIFLGTSDDGCLKLAELLGWDADLKKLIETHHATLEQEQAILAETSADLSTCSEDQPRFRAQHRTMNQLEAAIAQTSSELRTLASLLPHNSEINPHLLKARVADLDAALQQVETQIANTRALVCAERELLAAGSGVLRATIGEQRALLAHVLANLPKHLPRQPPETASTHKRALASADSKANKENEPAGSKKTVKKKPVGAANGHAALDLKVPVPTAVAYLTVSEYDAVPKYMIGRLTRDKINDLIAELNKIFDAKATLLRNTPSKLSKEARERYWEHRALITDEVKNRCFIIEKDIKEYAPQGCQFKLDPSGRSVISVLRHLNRIKEMRGGGCTRFVLM